MSMFSNLMGRIFGAGDKTKEAETAAEEAVETTEAAAEPLGAADAPPAPAAEAPPAVAEAPAAAEEAAAAAPAPEPAPAPDPIPQVDVAAKLNAMKAAHPEGDDLDWEKSIVDLMKLVGMDSSYSARKELALELGYSQGDIDSKGSAEMNIWLHQQVMAKLAENGGNVPADLLH